MIIDIFWTISSLPSPPLIDSLSSFCLLMDQRRASLPARVKLKIDGGDDVHFLHFELSVASSYRWLFWDHSVYPAWLKSNTMNIFVQSWLMAISQCQQTSSQWSHCFLSFLMIGIVMMNTRIMMMMKKMSMVNLTMVVWVKMMTIIMIRIKLVVTYQFSANPLTLDV